MEQKLRKFNKVGTSSAVETPPWLLGLLWEYRIVYRMLLMSHADQLIDIAAELAMDAKDNVADLQRKLLAVEAAKLELEARLRAANHALERLGSETCKSEFNLQI
jgi:hypothetical protein